MLLFDTSSIEAYVTENNPKYANRIIKQLKVYAKNHNFDDSFDPYKAAYASMPASASANHEVKQQYVNGHFCYAYKFGIMTNGLGIVRSIDFYNRDYLDSHPDIIVEKSINYFKDCFCVANRKTTNEKTIHADLLLAGISQLLTVIVADKVNQRQHIRSLKSFIA